MHGGQLLLVVYGWFTVFFAPLGAKFNFNTIHIGFVGFELVVFGHVVIKFTGLGVLFDVSVHLIGVGDVCEGDIGVASPDMISSPVKQRVVPSL